MVEKQAEALFDVIASGDTEAVGVLLENTPDLVHHWQVEAPNTPLHAAVARPAIVALLLAKGAEANIIDSDEDMATPLHLCAAGGHIDSARHLIDAGADLNAHSSWGTPLHCALGSIDGATPGNVSETVEFFLNAGADINASMNPDTDVWTPLHQAASEGLADGVEILLKHGAKIFLQKDGLTALRVAESMGFDDIASMLRQRGAS